MNECNLRMFIRHEILRMSVPRIPSSEHLLIGGQYPSTRRLGEAERQLYILEQISSPSDGNREILHRGSQVFWRSGLAITMAASGRNYELSKLHNPLLKFLLFVSIFKLRADNKIFSFKVFISPHFWHCYSGRPNHSLTLAMPLLHYSVLLLYLYNIIICIEYYNFLYYNIYIIFM
jgi:hypothetical protein